MLHLTTEPLTGWCHIDVTQRCRTCEWIGCMQAIADEYYPDAASIRVVLDNLSTHNPAAFYRFFPPEKARPAAPNTVAVAAPRMNALQVGIQLVTPRLTGQVRK